MNYPTLHRYLNGQADIEKMSVAHARKVAKAMGLTIDQMLNALEETSDIFEALERFPYQEGWNQVTDTLEIHVRDGIVLNGVETKGGSQYPLYLYSKSNDGGFNQRHGLTVEEFKTLAKDKNIFLK